MAGGWSQAQVWGNATSLAAVDSHGTQIISGAINTKGAWVEMNASTPMDITTLSLQVTHQPSLGGTDMAWDLSAGAAGSEAAAVIIQNVIRTPQAAGIGYAVNLPVNLKAGTRLSARLASVFANDSIYIQALGFDAGYLGIQGCGLYDTYGYSSGIPRGITVDAGTTANTKGAYTQLTASATNDLIGFALGFDAHSTTNTGGGDGSKLIDVAIGTSLAEKVILPNLYVGHSQWDGGSNIEPDLTPFFYIPIKAGTRIAVRSQCANNVAAERVLGVSLYGMRA